MAHINHQIFEKYLKVLVLNSKCLVIYLYLKLKTLARRKRRRFTEKGLEAWDLEFDIHHDHKTNTYTFEFTPYLEKEQLII